MKLLAAVIFTSLAAVQAGVAATPPVAEKRPFMVTSPNGARTDDYYWLRDDTRKDPAMLAYLTAENAYSDASLAPTKPLQDKLYSEFIGRVKQDAKFGEIRGHFT